MSTLTDPLKAFLDEAKIGDLYGKLTKLEITLDELLEFDENELKEVSNNIIKIDNDITNILIKNIKKYKNNIMNKTDKKTDKSLNNETTSIDLLYKRYNEVSTLKDKVSQSILDLSNNDSIINGKNDIGLAMDNIIKNIENKRDILLNNINDIKNTKELELKKQLNDVKIYYKELNECKNICQNQYKNVNMDMKKRKQFIFDTVNGMLSKYPSMNPATYPSVKFKVNDGHVNKFVNSMEINDGIGCKAPIIKKIEFNDNEYTSIYLDVKLNDEDIIDYEIQCKIITKRKYKQLMDILLGITMDIDSKSDTESETENDDDNKINDEIKENDISKILLNTNDIFGELNVNDTKKDASKIKSDKSKKDKKKQKKKKHRKRNSNAHLLTDLNGKTFIFENEFWDENAPIISQSKLMEIELKRKNKEQKHKKNMDKKLANMQYYNSMTSQMHSFGNQLFGPNISNYVNNNKRKTKKPNHKRIQLPGLNKGTLYGIRVRIKRKSYKNNWSPWSSSILAFVPTFHASFDLEVLDVLSNIFTYKIKKNGDQELRLLSPQNYKIPLIPELTAKNSKIIYLNYTVKEYGPYGVYFGFAIQKINQSLMGFGVQDTKTMKYIMSQNANFRVSSLWGCLGNIVNEYAIKLMKGNKYATKCFRPAYHDPFNRNMNENTIKLLKKPKNGDTITMEYNFNKGLCNLILNNNPKHKIRVHTFNKYDVIVPMITLAIQPQNGGLFGSFNTLGFGSTTQINNNFISPKIILNTNFEFNDTISNDDSDDEPLIQEPKISQKHHLNTLPMIGTNIQPLQPNFNMPPPNPLIPPPNPPIFTQPNSLNNQFFNAHALPNLNKINIMPKLKSKFHPK